MDKQKSKKTPAQKKADDVARSFSSEKSVKQDPSGSYTGRSENKYDKPQQDVDDL